LADASFIVFDIETTGGNPERNGITEISAIRYQGGEERGRFHSLVNPECPIPPIVRKMTGITNRMVKDEPTIDLVMPKFLEFIGTDILVSHNTIGDLKFLVYFAEKVSGHSLENFFLCTHLLTEKLVPEAKDKSLKGLAKHFNIPMDQAHRAEADAIVTLELFKELVAQLGKRGRTTVEDGIRLQGDLESGLRLGWGLDPEAGDKIPPGPGILYLYGKEETPLFISSTMHLEREFQKLSKYSLLPRQVMKLVLQSYRVGFDEHPNLFHAMLEEGSALIKKSAGYDPTQWHLRTPQALFIRKEGEGILLGVGRLEPGLRHAFGMVSDRKVVQTLIDAIGKAFDGKSTRNGVVFAAAKEPAIVSFLSGSILSDWTKMKRSRFSLSNIFNGKNRKMVAAACRDMQELAKMKLPQGMQRLLSDRGVIIGPALKRGGWMIYPVIDSAPQDPIEVSGDWREWLQKSDSAGSLITILETAPPYNPNHDVSLKDAARINATLWFVHINKGRGTRCFYYSLEQLKRGDIG
jgi:DNA polymerase III epsilon subunit family exonuclease